MQHPEGDLPAVAGDAAELTRDRAGHLVLDHAEVVAVIAAGGGQLVLPESIDSRRVTELAAWAGMTKQSMHELIGHLERTGYVRREPDPSDSRARPVRLTERGVELERDVVAASSRLHLRWLQQLGEPRFASLWSALEELTGRADPLPEADDLRRRATGGE
jgi:DNA-binding MarR family transcriptional regulator